MGIYISKLHKLHFAFELPLNKRQNNVTGYCTTNFFKKKLEPNTVYTTTHPS